MSDHTRDESELRIAAERATLPFRLLEQMRIPSGYERSFKMLPGRLLANRYLLGVDLNDLAGDQLPTICQRLNMPDEFVRSLAKHLPDANLVFLGFEDNPPNGVYKVYLEFWERVKSEVRSDPTSLTPKLLHLGFKWDADDNSQRTVSRYLCHPLLSVEDIVRRMTDVYAGHEDCLSLRIAVEIVAFAAHRTPEASFIYLEVFEEHSPRSSFDINLYAANLSLNDIQPALLRLRDQLAIPTDPLDRLFHLTSNKRLGHLSGGISQRGEEFLTVYYEA